MNLMRYTKKELIDLYKKAEKFAVYRNLLYVVSEIFGSLLDIETKLDSSVELFANFLDINEAAIILKNGIGDRYIFKNAKSALNVTLPITSEVIEELKKRFLLFELGFGEETYGYLLFPFIFGEGEEAEKHIDIFKGLVEIISQGLKVYYLKNELQQSKNFIESTLFSLNEGIVVVDGEGKCIYSNKTLEKLLRKEYEVLVKEGIFRTSIGEFFKRFLDEKLSRFEITFEKGKLNLRILEGEIFRFRYFDPDEKGKYVVVLRDVTKIRILERNMIEKEKLAMLGEMSARIAHELANPLTAVRGFLDIIYSSISDEEQKRFMKLVFDEIDYLGNVIENLLDYSKSEFVRISNININELLGEVLFVHRRLFEKKGIILIQELGSNLPKIRFSRGALKRALINIILNAVDAMPDGGKLKIKTYFKNGILSCEISDTGCGMSEELVKKIKKPFFTTKERGTGLGLAIVERCITKAGGELTILSEEGKGTIVRLDFVIL